MSKVLVSNINGKSAYQQAVEGGYEGTEAQFKTLLNDAVSETIISATMVGTDLVVTTRDGQTQNLGRVRGLDGANGLNGANGANVLPTSEAVAVVLTTPGPAVDQLTASIGEVAVRVNEAPLNPERYGAVADGVTDSTQALIDAHNALPARGGAIRIPVGKMLISGNVVFTKVVNLEGFAASPTANNGGSSLLLQGSASLTLKGGGSGVRNLVIDGKPGNTGPGLVVHAERFALENVTAINQGGTGVVIGDGSTYYNVNSGYISNLRSKANGGDGIWIGCSNKTSPDANAITALNLDLAENAGNGMTLDGTIDNTFIGYHSERNDGWGVQLIDAVSHFFTRTYIEFNDLGTLTGDMNSIYNYIMGGRRDDSFQLYEFASPENLVLGRDFTNGLFPFQTRGYFGRLGVSARAISGSWEFTQNAANRNLEIALAATSASSAVQFKSSGGGKIAVGVDTLRVGTMDATHGIQQILRVAPTLSFGTIPASGTAEKTVSLPGALVGDIVSASPAAAPPTGLVWSGYVGADGVVTIRVANPTDAGVVLGSVGFKCMVARVL